MSYGTEGLFRCGPTATIILRLFESSQAEMVPSAATFNNKVGRSPGVSRDCVHGKHTGVEPEELVMARLRLTIITTATFLALAAFEMSSLAQQQPGGPQQPGGAGGGRGGPGGGRGGFGGFGGGFNGLLGLASNAGVQTELKVTDKQKAAIKVSERETRREEPRAPHRGRLRREWRARWWPRWLLWRWPRRSWRQ